MSQHSFPYIPEAELEAGHAIWTAREIAQQPDMWLAAAARATCVRPEIMALLEPVLRQPGHRIILTGAGTSAYAGQCLAPFLTRARSHRVEAIATTDLVTSPDQYLVADVPTVLISFSRSGSSPESVAACRIASQMVKELVHLVVTCNANSELGRFCASDEACFLLEMPPETHDRSFAMTSSLTCMMVSVAMLLAPDRAALEAAVSAARGILGSRASQARQLACKPFRRAVFLGSGGLQGAATEARLKLLELTAGLIDCYSESPTGFRHGPKFVVGKETLIVLLRSGEAMASKYDMDLLAELERDGQAMAVIDLGGLPELEGIQIDDIWRSLPFLVYCQMLAFHTSLHLGCTPDNPCPGGEVNRVVQGVTIHSYQ